MIAALKRSFKKINLHKWAQRLESLSSIFFFSNFVTKQGQYLPNPLLSIVFLSFAILCLLSGNVLWLGSSLLYPDHPKHHDKWYGLMQFKYQFLIAALLGTLATVLSVGSIFVPMLMIPTAWLFFLSNVVWVVGEYHKYKNNPDYDDSYSHTQQEVYFRYALIMTALSFIIAVAVMTSFAFPPTTGFMVALTSIIGVVFSVYAFMHWLDFTFGGHKPIANKDETVCDDVIECSYERMRALKYSNSKQDVLAGVNNTQNATSRLIQPYPLTEDEKSHDATSSIQPHHSL